MGAVARAGMAMRRGDPELALKGERKGFRSGQGEWPCPQAARDSTRVRTTELFGRGQPAGDVGWVTVRAKTEARSSRCRGLVRYPFPALPQKYIHQPSAQLPYFSSLAVFFSCLCFSKACQRLRDSRSLAERHLLGPDGDDTEQTKEDGAYPRCPASRPRRQLSSPLTGRSELGGGASSLSSDRSHL